MINNRKSVLIPNAKKFESPNIPALNLQKGRRKSLNVVSVPSEFNLMQESETINTPTKPKIRHSLTMRQLGNNLMLQKLMKQNILSRIVNVSEFQVVFNFTYFIKFFFYHILFFYTGPTAVLPVLAIDSI